MKELKGSKSNSSYIIVGNLPFYQMSSVENQTKEEQEKIKNWVTDRGYDPLQDPFATGELTPKEAREAYEKSKDESTPQEKENKEETKQENKDTNTTSDEFTDRIQEYARLSNIKYTEDLEQYVSKNEFEIVNVDTEQIMKFRRKKITYTRHYELQKLRKELNLMKDGSPEKLDKELPMLRKCINYFLIDEQTGKAADPDLIDVLDLEELRKILDAQTLRTQFGIPK